MKIFANLAQPIRYAVTKRYNVSYINNYSEEKIENGLKYKEISSSILLNYFLKNLSQQIMNIGNSNNEGAIKVIENQIKIYKNGSWTNYIDENIYLNKAPANTPEGGWSIDGLTAFYNNGRNGYKLIDNPNDYVDLRYVLSLRDSSIGNYINENNIIHSDPGVLRHYYNETFLSTATPGMGDFKINKRKVFVFINTTQYDFVEIKKDLKPLFPDNAKIKILMRGEKFDKDDFKPISEVNLTGLIFKDWCEIEYIKDNRFLISNLSLVPCTLRGFISISQNKKYFETKSGERALTCDIPYIESYNCHSQAYYLNNKWYWIYQYSSEDSYKNNSIYLASIDLMNNKYSEAKLNVVVDKLEACFLIPHETHKDQLYCRLGVKTILINTDGNILDSNAVCDKNYIYVENGLQKSGNFNITVSKPVFAGLVYDGLDGGVASDEHRVYIRGYNIASIKINNVDYVTHQQALADVGTFVVNGQIVGYPIWESYRFQWGFLSTFIDGTYPSFGNNKRNILQLNKHVILLDRYGVFISSGNGVAWSRCLAVKVSSIPGRWSWGVPIRNIITTELKYGEYMFWCPKNEDNKILKRKYEYNYTILGNKRIDLIVDFGAAPNVPISVQNNVGRVYGNFTEKTINNSSYSYCNEPDIYFEYNGENVGDDILLFIPPDEQ